MRGAGNTQGADGCRGKTGGISGLGGAAKDAPLASQGAPGAAAQDDVRMLLQIPAAAIPVPKAEEEGGGGELNEWKPRLLLRRHQAGRRSTAGGGQAAQDKLLLDFARRRGGLDRKSTRLNSSHLGISYA